MNERIKQLLGQAYDEAVPETWTTLSSLQQGRVYEKFAELIVKECKDRLVRIMGTFDLATGHADTMEQVLDALEDELRDVLGHLRARREWQGLTDEEHDGIKHNYHDMTWTLEMFGRAIEQALKEKNHGTGRVYADETKIPEDVPCKTHPDAPHGFDRNMSHTLDRYVCECEHWEHSESWEPSK